ncbi:MAG: hypothetical protein BWX79_03267 [Alphaproteobacteria bacterium ADurb.Bin100]|nr:MAG: hypothetical protein BWX79_03267 [Alphaproteobacteria bacterium ADurb.Bin100]
MPPRRAVSSASSAVEISTPMPPTMIGTSSCLPNFKRKSSTRFIVILTDWTSPARRAPAIHTGLEAHTGSRKPSQEIAQPWLPSVRPNRERRRNARVGSDGIQQVHRPANPGGRPLGLCGPEHRQRGWPWVQSQDQRAHRHPHHAGSANRPVFVACPLQIHCVALHVPQATDTRPDRPNCRERLDGPGHSCAFPIPVAAPGALASRLGRPGDAGRAGLAPALS